MASYEVTITESEKYVLIIEAENETEACDKAYKKFDNSPDKGRYHRDSDGGIEALDIWPTNNHKQERRDEI